jgi:hypothetical protein
MKNQNNQFWKMAMSWGFYIALASVVLTTIYYVSDNYTNQSNWPGYLIQAAGIVLCAIFFKKTLAPNETFFYSRALGLGIATSFFASLIIALYVFVLYKYIDPTLPDQLLLYYEEQLLDTGLNADIIEQQIEIQRKIMQPAIVAVINVLSVTFSGLIISLITSIFVRNKPSNNFENAMSEINDEN